MAAGRVGSNLRQTKFSKVAKIRIKEDENPTQRDAYFVMNGMYSIGFNRK